MLTPAGSMTVASFSSGACGIEGSKTVLRSVGSLLWGKFRATLRPEGWSAWIPAVGWTGCMSILGCHCEVSAGLSQPVTAGVMAEAVFQNGSLRSGLPKSPTGSSAAGCSQESAWIVVVGCASEQFTPFEISGIGAPPLPLCAEGTPKNCTLTAVSSSSVIAGDTTLIP